MQNDLRWLIYKWMQRELESGRWWTVAFVLLLATSPIITILWATRTQKKNSSDG